LHFISIFAPPTLKNETLTSGIVYKPLKIYSWIEAMWWAYKTIPPIRYEQAT